MTHYIIVTSGEGEDYAIDGLYLCDHQIDPEEWPSILRAHHKESHRMAEEIYAAHGQRYGWTFSMQAHDAYIAWLDANEPFGPFAKKHGLVKAEYLEVCK